MTFYKTAYDTTVYSDTVTSKIIDELEKADIKEVIRKSSFTRLVPDAGETNHSIYLVTAENSDSKAIPAFTNPIIFNNHKDELKIGVDVRAFTGQNRASFETQVTNDTEFNLLILRAKLNEVWLMAGADAIKLASPMPMIAYANWISETVGRRFGLGFQEQLSVSIVAAVYYDTLFNDDAEYTERRGLQLVNHIAKTLRVDGTFVLSVYDKLIEQPYMSSVKMFCNALANVTGSIRLEDFNVGLLYSIMGGTWFGSDAKTLINVCLEHPPTWTAVLYSASTNNAYKVSALAKMLERNTYRDLKPLFIKSIVSLYKS